MRIKFTLLLSSFLFFSLFITGCKKKDYSRDYTYEIVFKKNGVEETMTPTLCKIILKSTMPSVRELQLVGVAPDFKNSFTMALTLKGDIAKGEYTSLGMPADGELGADYYINQGKPDEKVFSVTRVAGKPEPDFKLLITALDEQVIRGSFSCNFMYDWVTHEAITITEGRFTAKRR